MNHAYFDETHGWTLAKMDELNALMFGWGMTKETKVRIFRGYIRALADPNPKMYLATECYFGGTQ